MKLIFDTKGNEKQKLCAQKWVDESIEEILYGGAKGGAKSYTGCSLIFHDALTYPNTHYFIARKKLNDIRRFTIPSIHEVFKNWGVNDSYYNYNGQDSYFELYNKSRVYLLDAKYLPSDPQYQRFGSMQMTRGWIEEAGEFEYDSYANLKISIGRWNNKEYNLPPKLLMTCNPSKNFLYEEFYIPFRDGDLMSWRAFIQAFIHDNKTISENYIRNLERTLTESEKKRLLYGNWEYDDDPDALIGYDNIIALFNNDHVTEDNLNKYITADIARLGSDLCVIMVWYGWVVKEVHVFDKSYINDIQNTINALRSKHVIPKHNCIADEDGVGGGVVDNCGIIGFVNNKTPFGKENYQNLKTQCYYKLAERINRNEIYIIPDAITKKDEKRIIKDLENVKSYNVDLEGKLRILPKKELGYSPDYSDTIMLREYFELAPKKRYVGRA